MNEIIEKDIEEWRMLLKKCGKRLIEEELKKREKLGGKKIVIGMRGEFRIRKIKGKKGGKEIEEIVEGKM